MIQLAVETPKAYPVVLGHGLSPLANPSGPRALLYDRAVEGFAEKLADRLDIPARLALEGGEGAKTLEVYARCLSWLAREALPRNTTLYVVGGGTLTDLGGFVAASYLRGIGYISFPTTTLAIVDAAVGGKTGLNLPEGKNLVGAFHFPQAVYADLEALSTLPLPLFKEGLVEAFKHGLIAGDETLLQLEPLAPGWGGLEEYLARAVAVKIRVVEADPTEKGERKKLNLGHTLAHALEAATAHQVSHGAAVAYGLLYISLVGRALGGQDLVPTAQRLLTWLEPPPLPELSWEGLLPYLARDKKKLGTSLSWAVPMGLGDVRIEPVDDGTLRQAYGEFQELINQPGQAAGSRP
ncbi:MULTISPECIES: 3-dehydroquinate synthase [unclassified Meiothermus]|uniref:3-dehydroquinate synthase family protein n=1 Tax=unclassified Meiothermus TaxID=370471 RepID=UPI000D7BE18F|nr:MULTISPECIES: 3-dehydroquinate synthase family protein [unclassified Meiothermus]PZA08895.1 3-dehydroquinate synthase [Meiothermus sp. Pnk-1]RYM33762.1 3-dehydroquinate synthase [Meiothermus sp. PNK-Is4]